MKTLSKLINFIMIVISLQLSTLISNAQCVQCGTGSFISTTNGNGAISMGHYINNTGTRSIIIGEGYSEQYYLTNNLAHRIIMGVLSTKPTFTIFESPFSALHDKTGKVGIGNVTSPSAKLHIKADAGEAAIFLVEPNTWGVGATAMLQVGNQNHGIIGSYTNGLEFKTQRHYIFNDGNVGIGTTSPAHLFHVNFNGSRFYLDDKVITMESLGAGSTYPSIKFIGFNRISWTIQNNELNSNSLEFVYNGSLSSTMTLNENGLVGIGTNPTIGYKLSVLGKILTDEVMVLHPDQWPDYVFDNNYLLPDLNELNNYIRANRHLPGIPTTKDVMENGFGLAHMNGLLLQKVEELTLYIIDQEARIKALEEKLEMNQSQSIEK